MRNRPALVYAVPSARDDINEYLHEHNLYRIDDLQETDTDLTRPSDERPILRRVMLFASTAGGAESTALVPDGDWNPPRVFVTDDLETLGLDEISQVAVIGALLASDLEVLVNYEKVDDKWFHAQVRRLGGFTKISPIMNSLLAVIPHDAETRERWEEASERWQQAMPGENTWILPTSLLRGWPKSIERIRVLIEEKGIPAKEIAEQLSAEGYQNKHGRFIWYEKAVRDAYEARP